MQMIYTGDLSWPHFRANGELHLGRGSQYNIGKIGSVPVNGMRGV